MYCPQCGKQIDDNSRFCFQCGARVTVPAESVGAGSDRSAAKRSAPKAVKRETRYAPYEDEPNAAPQYSFREEEKGAAEEEYVPFLSRKPEKEAPSSYGKSAANLPYEDEVEDEEDEYDVYDRDERNDSYDVDDDGYEEPEERGFLERFGPVLIVVVLLIAIVTVGFCYLKTSNGQGLMAKLGMASSPESYVIAAKKAYQEEDYATAGTYLEKALSMNTEDYATAYNAAVAFFRAGNTEKAESMARRAILLQPDDPDPYIVLMRLYPDANTRSMEINTILQNGYERTGDARILGMTEISG